MECFVLLDIRNVELILKNYWDNCQKNQLQTKVNHLLLFFKIFLKIFFIYKKHLHELF